MKKSDRIKKALDIAHESGDFDGAHHKNWVIDQMVRALTGCPMVGKTLTDTDGRSFAYEAQGESEEYLAWVARHKDGEDGPETYEWDEGIAP